MPCQSAPPRSDALLTAQMQSSAIREDRSSHQRLAGRLHRAASLRFGKRASLNRGQARVPTDASVSRDRADERPLSRLRQGSHRAARVRRAGRTLKHAMADDPRGEGEGQVGGEGLRAVGRSYRRAVPVTTKSTSSATTTGTDEPVAPIEDLGVHTVPRSHLDGVGFALMKDRKMCSISHGRVVPHARCLYPQG